MRRCFQSGLLAICLGVLPTMSQAQDSTQTGAPAPRPSYAALLARFRASDSTLDVTALRMAYAASAAYAPYGSDADEPRERLSAALEKQDYRRAIKEADAALQVEYLDVRTHVLKAYALEQLGDTAGAQWHRVAAARLVHSITDGATGTVESPYVVISVAEEYAVLGMTGYARQQQALGECGAHPCDILEAVHRESGDTRVFYFDITIPQRHLEQALGGK